MDDFSLLNSGVKKVTYKLRENKSIAVTDNTFLKAFLSGSISCEDLKTEAKGFLMEGTETYDKIMDKIHVDYRAQMSGEQMRNLSLTKQLCHGKSRNVPTKWKGSVATPPPVQRHIKLPPSTGSLIPNAYYQKFKGLYEASRVPETDRSEDWNFF